MSTDPRERILDEAARLLVAAGTEGVSTRAVASAAGVQAPTLYRLFGDKQGLLDAVVAHGFERYLSEKHALTASKDPIEDLRRGWQLHVEFGLSHPAFYTLMFGNVRPGHEAPAAADANRLLLAMLRRAAEAGVLQVPVETAAQMIHSACVGLTLTLIARPVELRDGDLSRRVQDAIFGAVLVSGGDAPVPRSLAARALALDATLDTPSDGAVDSAGPGQLSRAEIALLRQWLRRLATP